MLPHKIEGYLVAALAGAPDLAGYLLFDVTAAQADFRPFPDRFTIREAISHVADWEAIFLERLKATLQQERATLVGIDEGEVARLGNYGERDWWEQSCIFAARRAETVSFIRALAPADWDRTAGHTEIGTVTLAEQIVLISAHDAYHLQQFAEWRKLFASADGGV